MKSELKAERESSEARGLKQRWQHAKKRVPTVCSRSFQGGRPPVSTCLSNISSQRGICTNAQKIPFCQGSSSTRVSHVSASRCGSLSQLPWSQISLFSLPKHLESVSLLRLYVFQQIHLPFYRLRGDSKPKGLEIHTRET